ncbi:MAG: VCBS domain-containing protein, partial [Candidatus Nanopelagicales bacterium]
ADGSYSYRLDNTNAAVNALKDTETLSETFSYTITDADGDPSTTTLTLTINGSTDGGPSIVPVDGNAGATGQATVLEAGLTGSATTETTSGTISVGSPDGLASVKVGGVTLTVAELQALSGTPQVIDTGEGTLTLTGFSGTGTAPLSGVISYTYTLKAALNQPGASESSDLIALEVTDRGGITTTGTLTVQIVDDTPTANADSNDISEDAAPNAVIGNVMTTGAGQDLLSADATWVTGAVAGTGMPSSNVASGTTSASGTTILGVYGSIRIGSDGSYSYTLDNTKASVQALNAGESTTETFTYTITDADGDPSTTTLTITIRGTDDGVALTVPDTNAGATGNASVPENGTLTGQTLAISAPDGLDATAALTIAGSPVTKAALENSATSNVTINTPEGVLTITGYNPVTGVVTYSYDPSGTAKNHTGGEVLDTISIVVKDDNGDTQPGNLVINIVDTAPLAKPDTNTVTEDTAPNPVAGNVITTGGGADTLGADAAVVTGIMAGSGTPGNNVASGTTSVNGTSVNGTYGTLVLGADGSYSYTLDNARPAVQALARNQAVSETFTYTITDADGDPSSTTLTITVTGTNDVPIIDVRVGDADSASLTETNSGLIVSDKLSVFDVDTQDTVAASKVDSLAVGGTYSGARPSDTLLKAMFSVSGGEGSTVAQDAPNGITWTFDSGSEAFNSIPAGQTLILTYTVRATDSQGAFVDQPVTITITGTNDGVVAVNDSLTIAENATGAALGGNVLSNDTLDPDAGATTTVSSFSLDADGNGSQDVFAPGTPVTVTTPSGTLGVLTMASNGAYTFTPHQANYSGPVPVITYTLASSTGETATATLTLNVTPVSDAPGVTRDAATVTTNEDMAVALGFNAPTVTDAVDQNGSGSSGDNPERLSLISLTDIPRGAILQDGSGNNLYTIPLVGNTTVTIRLSDAT